MQRMICTCDHCGKELDEMKDFTDMHIDNFWELMNADLCNKCFHELNDMVAQFINYKKDE